MKKVTNFLRRTVFNKEWWSYGRRVPNGIIAICIVVGIIIGPIVFCNILDTTKATAEDYAPLYEQVDAIQNDFDNILYMDNAEITIEENVLIVLKSEECNLLVRFKRDRLDDLSITEEDKAYSTAEVIIIGILIGAPVGMLVMLIIILAMVVVWCIRDFLRKILNKNKKKK